MEFRTLFESGQIWVVDCLTLSYQLYGYCNAGSTISNTKAKHSKHIFGEDIENWLTDDGIANITSLPVMKKLSFHITYDSHNDFWVVTNGDMKVIFFEDEQGLPYIDLEKEKQGVAFVQTVRKSFEGYTKNEIKKAITAREAPTMLGCLSERDIEYLVSSKELDDCPVTPHDSQNANAIFCGPDTAGVRGETVRQAPQRVITDNVVIPGDFLKLHTHVTLVADVIFVNNIPFLVT